MIAVERPAGFVNRFPDLLHKQSARTEKFWNRIRELQSGSIIHIIPAQLGRRWIGKSAEDARTSFAENEFGLGTYEVAIMLLTHPKGLFASESHSIDASGDEVRFPTDTFSLAPFFRFGGDQVEFSASWFDSAHYNYGSASAFLPAEAR